MTFKAYSKPHRVGWLGWFEDEHGNAVGYFSPTGGFFKV